MRRFYGFLETEGVISENPVPPFHLAAGGRKLPQTLSQHDVRKLLAQPNPQEPLGVRDLAMLELLYATGLRVSELIALQMQQINFQGNFLTVKGKGSKVRAVPFGKWARQKLLDYGRSFSLREKPAWSAPMAIFIGEKSNFSMLV